MYPIFVSTHPLAALCLDACSQPRTFSFFQISPSSAPHPLPARSRPCLLLAGRQEAGSSRGLSAAFLPGRKLPHPWMLQTVTQQKLVLMGRLLPEFLVGRYTLLCNKDGESKLLLSRCFPVCFTLMGEREDGKNNSSVLFEKGCLQRPEQGGWVAAPLRVWPGLEILGTEAHARSSVENLAPCVFWIDTGFRDLENKSCWHVGAVGSLGKYPEQSWI